MDDRSAKILEAVEPTMHVLELGPGYSPLAPKRDGWKTCTVDHASREELVDKYASERDVDVSLIEDVDVIWNAGPLHEALPAESHGTFDAVIGSHVLEHIPDPIGLFVSLDRLLKPGGVISLAIPDNRFCFDFFKPLSSVGELLDAHRHGATRHSLKNVFDFAAYSVSSRGQICWGRGPVTDVAFLFPFDDARAKNENYVASEHDPYVDCHAWHFTPSSFQLAMLELCALGVVPFSIERQLPPEGCEFYVRLTRASDLMTADARLQARRLELLNQTIGDIREQANFLLCASHNSGTSNRRTSGLRRIASNARRRIRRRP